MPCRLRAGRRKGSSLRSRAAHALAAPVPKRPRGWVLRAGDRSTRNTAVKMRTDRLRAAAGAAMLAVVLYALLAAAGLVSDHDSLVPVRAQQESRR